jgi:hypothetical protein
VASETVAMEVGGRWHDSVAVCDEGGDEAMTRAFKRWVRLTVLAPFDLIRFSKAPTSKFTNMIFPMSKNGETF